MDKRERAILDLFDRRGRKLDYPDIFKCHLYSELANLRDTASGPSPGEAIGISAVALFRILKMLLTLPLTFVCELSKTRESTLAKKRLVPSLTQERRAPSQIRKSGDTCFSKR